MEKKASNRLDRALERRAAIIEAALEEFTAKGFAAAKVDDIARRAGVAKGTVYLNFADKEALFEGMVRAYVTPPLAELEAIVNRAQGVMPATFAEVLVPAMALIPSSKAGDVMRLLISEGFRFPRVAELYYREVLSPILAHQSEHLAKAKAEQRLLCPALADFPQLLLAPLIMGVIWQGLFDEFAPLDIENMLKTHSECLLRADKRWDGGAAR